MFTEGYPQRNDNKFNTILLDKLRLSGFDLYCENYSDNCILIFMNKAKCENEGLKYKDIRINYHNDDIEYPDLKFVSVKYDNNKGFLIGGIRIKNDTKPKTGDVQIKNVKRELCNILKQEGIRHHLLIGDFNPSRQTYNSKEEINLCYFKDVFMPMKIEVIETQNGGSSRTQNIDNCKTLLRETYPDKVLTNICKDKIEFYKLLTPEQYYLKDEYLNNDGHLKRNDTKGNEIIYIKKWNAEYDENGKLKKKGNTSLGINKELDIYKFNDREISFKYASMSCCDAPYPDHNLLFASIEI